MTKLVSVLGMMGSEHDGEILNAARFAEKLRRSMDKTWGQLLTGKDDTATKGSEFQMMMRALRAESRVLTLEKRVAELEKQLKAMADAKASTASSEARAHGDKYWLDPVKLKLLIDRLLDRPAYPDDIYAITNWPRAHLRVVLGRIAKQRGLHLDVASPRYGHGQRYSFRT